MSWVDELDLPSSVPFSQWPKTLIGNVWLYDPNHPETLLASVVKADKTKTVFVVDHTDTEEFAPQTLTRYATPSYAASAYGGERTSDGLTTTWFCDFEPFGKDGDSIPVSAGKHAKCGALTGKSLDGKEVKATAFEGECFTMARPVVAVTTAGINELKDVYPYYGQQIDDIDAMVSELAEAMSGDYDSVCTNAEQKSEAKITPAATTNAKAAASASEEATKTVSSHIAEETGAEQNNNEGDGDKDDSKDKEEDSEPKDSSGVRISATSVSLGLMVLTASILRL